MASKSAIISKYMGDLARKGSAKAAAARMAKISPERRQEIARNAALARHGKLPS